MCMLIAYIHILEVCVYIQLDCACMPYVCTCILVLRNPNPSLFASVSLFCLYNMPLSELFFLSLSLCFSILLCFVCLPPLMLVRILIY